MSGGGIERRLVTFARVDGMDLHLHVIGPRSQPPRSILLDLHGGAWTYFDPSVDFYWAEELAARGHLVACAEFRLAPRYAWPTFLCDIRAAARWLHQHRQQLGAEACPVGVMGGSTGGHLSAMLALWPEDPAHPVTTAIDTPDNARADVDFAIPLWPILDVPGRYRLVRDTPFDPIARRCAGWLPRRPAATDLSTADPLSERLRRLGRLRRRAPRRGDFLARALQALSTMAGIFPPTRAALYAELTRAHEGAFSDLAQMEEASPLHRLRRGVATRTPPLLIVQGGRDTNMTIEMTQAFVDEYRQRGGRVTFEIVPGQGHSYGNVPSPAADALIARIDAFIGSRRL